MRDREREGIKDRWKNGKMGVGEKGRKGEREDEMKSVYYEDWIIGLMDDWKNSCLSEL